MKQVMAAVNKKLALKNEFRSGEGELLQAGKHHFTLTDPQRDIVLASADTFAYVDLSTVTVCYKPGCLVMQMDAVYRITKRMKLGGTARKVKVEKFPR